MTRRLWAAVAVLLAGSAWATVPTTTSIAEYTCDGTTKTYAVPYKFLDQAHLRISRVLIASPDTETVLALTTDYTVGGTGASTGGTVVLVAPATSCPSSSYSLRIRRVTTRTQGTAFSTSGAFTPKTDETPLDRFTMVAQELNDGGAALNAYDFTGPNANAAAVTAVGSTTARRLDVRLSETINVKDFGAMGDGVTDDTAAIQAAIAAAEAYTSGATVLFPPGLYRVTSTIRISKNYIRLLGTNRVAPNVAGTNIGAGLFTSTSGIGSVLLVHAAAGGIYGVRIEGLRVHARNGLKSPPDGITFKDASEVSVENFYMGGGLSSGIVLNGVTLAILDRGDFGAASAVGIKITLNGTSVFTSNDSVWVSRLNIFETTTASVLIDGHANTVTIRDSYAEFTPAGVKIAPRSGTDMTVDGILLDGFSVFNGTTSPYTNARFLLATAPRGAGNYLRTTNIDIRNSRSRQNTATYHVEFLNNGNSHGTTAFLNTLVDGGQWYAASTAILNNDKAGSNGAVRGNVVARTGYQTGVAVPYRAGAGTVGWGTEETGAWTPTDNSGATLSFAIANASDCRYTKIGRIVFASFAFTYPATASDAAVSWAGLPFTSASTTTSLFGGGLSYTDAAISPLLLVNSGAATVNLRDNAGSSIANSALSGKRVRGTIIYEAQ